MGQNEYQELEQTLREMKNKLQEHLLQLESEMNLISSDADIDDKADLSSLVTDAMDHSALIKQQKAELAEVNHALSKFAQGSYGICEKSGQKIPIERLRAEPQARHRIDAE